MRHWVSHLPPSASQSEPAIESSSFLGCRELYADPLEFFHDVISVNVAFMV